MKTYRVTIRQSVVKVYQKDFRAKNIADAEAKAEDDQEDGLDGWEITDGGPVIDQHIDYVEELK